VSSSKLKPEPTIYGSSSLQTSKNTLDSRAIRAVIGLALGGAIWLTISLLGAPMVFHLDSMIGLIPFALAGALVFLTRFGRVLAWIGALLIILLIVIAYTPVVIGTARTLIRTDPVPARADAVVVLSAGVTVDGFLQGQGLDRLLTGLALIKRGVAPLLIITREERDLGDRKVNTVADQEGLIALAGVVKFVATPLEASTHDEAMAVKRIADQAGWNRIVLVTSPFHTKRACATFEHVGLTVSCVPSDSRDIAVHSLSTPRDRVNAFSMLIYELAATLQYKRLGWV
jgi:uncharacterized SAM-binding protein YcdF (DUF218 family)